LPFEQSQFSTVKVLLGLARGIDRIFLDTQIISKEQYRLLNRADRAIKLQKAQGLCQNQDMRK
jgi:hypothetical protein